MPEPFLVIATQNPIESEGTYPLPEAQVDRFMLKVLVDYPAHDEELTVVARSLKPPAELSQVLTLPELKALQQKVAGVYVDPALISWSVDLASATRRPADDGAEEMAPYVSYGASPRGPISLIGGARALAIIRGRDYVLPSDMEALVARRLPPPARPLLPGARRRGGRRPGARRGARERRRCRRSTSAAAPAAA